MIRVVVVVLCIIFIAWMNPEADKAGEGNRLYHKKLYDEAIATYTETLIALPGSPRLHFNIGDAAYKKGNYKEAVKSFEKAELLASDPKLEGKIYYNLGNCKYRQGRLKENTNVGKAIDIYRKALEYYKQAMDRYPKDSDIKFNHEFVERRIKELLEAQTQQGEQQQEGQQGEQQEEQQGEQQQGQKRQQGQQEQDQEGTQQQPEGDQQEGQQGDQESQQGQEGQEGTNEEAEENSIGQAGVQEEQKEQEGQGQKGNLTTKEAKMLLDSLKDEELHRPDNRQTRRQLQQVLRDW